MYQLIPHDILINLKEKGKWSDRYIYIYNEAHNGLINDVEIVFIDETDPSYPTRREEFWRNRLNSLAPYGLNVEE